MIEIYTDGACRARVGGWAALILAPEQRRSMSGKTEYTTSNRMELSAAINSMESLPGCSEVTLYSDSEYLVKTMIPGWRRNANLDLWQRPPIKLCLSIVCCNLITGLMHFSSRE